MKNRFLFATCFTFLLALVGCGDPAAPAKDKVTLGTHTLTIVDSSGGPLGGTTGTNQDDVAGTKVHSFESANGRYKIELQDEVLTINGVEYMLDKPESEIRIVDDQVEINDQAVFPDTK